MANPLIQIKRSAVSGKIPSTSNLQLGELAVNTYDGKVYIKQDQSAVGIGTTVITINPWSVGVGSIVYNTYFTAGSVGIGTTNPSQKFEVVGGEIKAGRIDTGSEGGQLSFGRSTDNATAWYLDVYGSTSTPDFRVIDVSNAAVRAVFSGSGNFGVNNASPTSRLDVSGDAKISGVVTATSFKGDGSGLTGISAGSTANVSTSTLVVSGFSTLGATSATLFRAVGISTFQNNVSIAGTVSVGSSISLIPYNSLGTLSWEGSAGQLFSITNNLTSGSIFAVNDVSGIPSIDVNADGTIALAPFAANEKVGIGSTGPTSKLDVSGDVKVSGIVTATSFRGDGSQLTGISASSSLGIGTAGGTVGTAITFLSFKGAALSSVTAAAGIATVTVSPPGLSVTARTGSIPISYVAASTGNFFTVAGRSANTNITLSS